MTDLARDGSPDSKSRVVIIGGGFGGLAVCRRLNGADCRVLLLDRRNHHLFQPLLYQVATAGLSGSDVAQPIRRLVEKQPNAEIHLAGVVRVDLDQREVRLADRAEPIGFDAIVIACGVETNWFGHPEWEGHAIGLKSLTDAYAIRERVLRAWERAENLAADGGNEAEVRRLLTAVVVGGGATGVEMAGALAELARRCIGREYRRLKPEWSRVILVDAVARLLPGFHERSSSRASTDLRELGVDVRLGKRVEEVGDGWVRVSGERIEAETVVWAAGVRAPEFVKTLGVETDRAGRVKVGADCRVPGQANAWVIGDVAALVDGKGATVPGVAQGALQAGEYVGRAVAEWVKAREGRPSGGEIPAGEARAGSAGKPFVYRDKGTMATIGRSRAVAELNQGKWRFGGTLAWLIWLFVHLVFLIDVRSKITVFVKWVWAYVWYDPTSRILTERRG